MSEDRVGSLDRVFDTFQIQQMFYLVVCGHLPMLTRNRADTTVITRLGIHDRGIAFDSAIDGQVRPISYSHNLHEYIKGESMIE